MLMLTRKSGERVVFTLPDGQQFALLVIKTSSAYVKFGFEAPMEIRVNRKEIEDRIAKEQ